jgi:hypothetical protein
VPLPFWIVATVAAAGVVALVWTLGQGFGGHPLSISPVQLSNWTLVTSDGTDPWVVAAQPPATFSSDLLRQVSRQAGQPLVPPHHAGVPLVLRSEFDDALQGVYGVDEVLRIARDAGVDTTAFQPFCIARKVQGTGSSRAELYFLVLDAPAFNQMRIDLTPTQPEHAGIGTYDPTVVTPVLVIGATDDRFDRWWPLTVNRDTDCQARVADIN